MALYKNDGFVADPWSDLPAGAAVPPQGHVILTREQWLAQRDALIDGTAPLGLRLEPGVAIEPILPDLHRFAMIALVFPKFSDGRAFSTAKILRIEQGYGGEIRAVGDVLFDQLQLMQRCGFDAYEIVHEPTLRALESGRSPGVSNFYQPGIGPEIPAGTRPWARRVS